MCSLYFLNREAAPVRIEELLFESGSKYALA